jgi:hypothetical protein
MAAARNLGARAALDDGAEVLIFLDVDCIPAPGMVGRYVRAAEHPDHNDALLCGPVTYLPAPEPDGYDLARLPALADPHPARPVPDDDQVLVSTEYELFWSLSFALAAPVWQRIGGFCTEYTGYGGEDTDFAQKAAAESITMRWVAPTPARESTALTMSDCDLAVSTSRDTSVSNHSGRRWLSPSNAGCAGRMARYGYLSLAQRACSLCHFSRGCRLLLRSVQRPLGHRAHTCGSDGSAEVSRSTPTCTRPAGLGATASCTRSTWPTAFVRTRP